MATATATPMTMTQKIIAIAVAIIIISTVAIPVIGDVQSSVVTTANNVDGVYSLLSTDEDVVLGFADTNTPTINGVALPNPKDKTIAENVYVITDTGVARIWWLTATQKWATAWFVSSASVLGGTYAGNFCTDVTYSGGTMTYEVDSDTYTETYTFLMVPNASGNYAAYHTLYDLPVYVDSNSKIYAAGSYNNFSFVAHGKLSELNMDFAIYGANPSVDVTDSSSVDITYAATGVTNEVTAVTVKLNGNEITGYLPEIIVPIEYSVIKEGEGGIYSLIGVIPILLILVPVMLAVRMITLRRN